MLHRLFRIQNLPQRSSFILNRRNQDASKDKKRTRLRRLGEPVTHRRKAWQGGGMAFLFQCDSGDRAVLEKRACMQKEAEDPEVDSLQ